MLEPFLWSCFDTAKAATPTATSSGVQFPAGLVEADRLPERVFTPTSNAGHDEFITMAAREAQGELRALMERKEVQAATTSVQPRSAQFAPHIGRRPTRPTFEPWAPRGFG